MATDETTTEGNRLAGLSLGQLADRAGAASYTLGVMAGLEKAAEILLDEAAGHWKYKRDEQAVLLRMISERLKNKAQIDRKEWDKGHKTVQDECFAELDRRERAATESEG